MRTGRTLRVGFALLLALLLPLRSFGAMPGCAATLDSPAAPVHHCSDESPGQHTDSANHDSAHHDGSAHATAYANDDSSHHTGSSHDDGSAHHDSAQQTDSSHHTDSTRHHECGSCYCGAAVAVTAIHWAAPFLPAAPTWEIVHSSAPSVALDRLDRPPRHVPG